jgi:hypothetical protein
MKLIMRVGTTTSSLDNDLKSLKAVACKKPHNRNSAVLIESLAKMFFFNACNEFSRLLSQVVQSLLYYPTVPSLISLVISPLLVLNACSPETT